MNTKNKLNFREQIQNTLLIGKQSGLSVQDIFNNIAKDIPNNQAKELAIQVLLQEIHKDIPSFTLEKE